MGGRTADNLASLSPPPPRGNDVSCSQCFSQQYYGRCVVTTGSGTTTARTDTTNLKIYWLPPDSYQVYSVCLTSRDRHRH
jgi:hypothetical protein